MPRESTSNISDPAAIDGDGVDYSEDRGAKVTMGFGVGWCFREGITTT